MYSGAVSLVVLASFLVKCEALTNGNLSAVNLTPRITSSTVAPGLGAHILAALGQTPTYTNTTTPSGAPNTTTTSTNGSSDTSLTPSTICYPGSNRCFDDVFYTKPYIDRTGNGAAYATSCSSISSAYNSASNSWVNKHSYQTNYTNILGGTSWIPITYYANATTLCDGHARVTYSPAIVLSSTTVVSVGTAPSTSVGTASMGWIFPISSPICSVNPSDCDGLWQAYSTSSSQWAVAANATRPADAMFPLITPSPSIPACINSSASASNEAFSKSFYGCGLCTIFGDEVELMYFPEATSVSRDMCATTPAAKLTSYGKDDGVPYTGAGPSDTWDGSGTPPETAVVGDHTFTSGTAYISIKKVWAVDRCSSRIGTTVTGAILALPSDRLLSLRYSQNHFQYFATTNKITGYPFNYADLNTPIPYSAWNGQARCEFPGAADYECNVIYEHDYNPQLAMPPGIRKLNPDWEGCQMWYGGLYDPPYALKPGTTIASPTLPWANQPVTTTSAEQASTARPTTASATALADRTSDGQNKGDTQRTQETGQTQPVNTAGNNAPTQNSAQNSAQNTQAAQNTQGGGSQNNNGGNSQGGNNNGGNGQSSQGNGNTQGSNNNNGAGQNTQGSQNTQAQNSQGGQNTQSGAQNTAGGQTQNGALNSQASQSNGQADQSQNAGSQDHWNPAQGQSTQGAQNNQGSSTANGAQQSHGSQAQSGSTDGVSQASTKPHVYIFTAGTYTYTATKTNTVYVCGTETVSVGGPAVTLPVNCVISAGTDGLIINTQAAAVTNHASAVTALPIITKAVIVTVGTKIQTVSEGASGVVQIGSTRLTAGGSAATLEDGSVVSVGSEGVKIGSTIVRYSTVTPAPAAGFDVIVFVVGTRTVTASCPPGNTNEAVIGTVTLTAGGAIQTLSDGSRVSLASGGTIVVDGTSAAAIATPASAVVFSVNGRAVTAYQASGVSSVATIDGTVISRDGPAVTLSSGETVSMGSEGLVVQQASTTVPVSAFTTLSGESDGSSPSSGASGSGSRSGSGSVTGSDGITPTRSAEQNQGSQTATAGATSIIRSNAAAGLMTAALLVSPLVFAIYL
ncbi:hypothetical protein E4T47_01161 [Aureobasidium subglaciale]|nr:hypothetical protein E4T47_01161 [Aureobasidium subglaciale]